MKDTIGYPYTYGDYGGSFIINRSFVRIMFFIFLTTSSFSLMPSISSALNSTELLAELAACIEGGKTCNVISVNHPSNLIVCAIAGFCVAKTSDYASAGKYKEAAAFACGGITAICAERIIRLASN